MTKAEMVDKLNAEGLGTKTSLKQLSTEELQKMIDELNEKEEQNPEVDTVDKESDTVSETDTKTDDETQAAEEESSTDQDKKDSDKEVVSESVHQLSIFTEFIYHAKNDDVAIMVKNLGNGDAYVSKGKVRVGDKSQRLLKGESVVIEGTKVINLMAASQPEVKITELK